MNIPRKSTSLNIIDNNKKAAARHTFRPKTRREEVQAQFEALWNYQPEKFDPQRNSMERERLKRTLKTLERLCSLKEKKIVDLGCGSGVFSRMLRDKSGEVTSVDIAKKALENFKKQGAENILIVQDLVPYTKLNDSSFDLVIAMDLIGHLKPKEHRLFISEMARLAKRDGYIICSTPLDIHSEDALESWFSLLETELVILEWTFSYHRYYIQLQNMLQTPLKYALARHDCEYRQKELNKRSQLKKLWFKLNSAPGLGDAWKILQPLTNLIYEQFSQKNAILTSLEKTCRFLQNENGVSHAIIVAKKRSLLTEKKAGEALRA